MSKAKINIIVSIIASLLLSLAAGCSEAPQTDSTINNSTDEASRSSSANETTWGINYGGMSQQDALKKKYTRMRWHCRNAVEEEVLRVIYEGLSWGRERGMFMHINIEDLMAEARQESGGTIDRLAQGKDLSPEGSIGTTVWNFHQIPGNDLNGLISLSVWQGITHNYLIYGRKFSDKIQKLVEDYVYKYGIDPGNTNPDDKAIAKGVWAYSANMEKVEGKEKAKELAEQFLQRLVDIVSEDPTIHVKVIASLIEENYATYGVDSPNAIRAYFWLAIQKNLDPKNWLNPVRYDDDVPPAPENNFTDNNVSKRGDYAKQVVLGNTYNDRGIIYWYVATNDEMAMRQMIKAWEKDPARLTKEDYLGMREKGYFSFEKEWPGVVYLITSMLPTASDQQ